MNQINQFVGLTGNTANDLTYIYKIMTLFEKFTNEEIFKWYCGLSRRNKDIKVNDKPSVSINYVLLSNPDVHHIIDDKFLTTLLIDCVDQIEISEELELRIVDIINKSHAKLHKYVHRHANRLNFQIETNEIIKINNDCAYYMAQDIVIRSDSTEIFRKLLLKLKDQRYKEEVEKYIKSQGIINETIFIHAIVSDVHSYRYINNIDIGQICKLICYKHLSKFIDRSIITQQFLISKNYQNCILQYSRLVEIENDLINKLEAPSFLTKDEFILILLCNRTKLKQSEIQTIIEQGSLLLLEHLIKIEAQLSGMLTRDILQLENKVNLKKIYEKYGFELVKKEIEPQNHRNLEIYDQYKKLLESMHKQDIIDIKDNQNPTECTGESHFDKKFYQLICKTKGYLDLEESEQIKLVEYFSNFCDLNELMPLILDLKQTSNKINEFFVKNLDQINKSEYKNILYDDNAKVVKIKPQIVNYKNGDDILKTLELLCTTEVDILIVESFLRELFSDYCFDFYGDYLPRLIKNFQKEQKICKVIFKIQENVINILEIGFFNPNFFILIKNILNTIIKYRVQDNCPFCSKVRKNNDKIIILLSYFTQFFDKNFQIGNVNKKN